MVKKEAQGKIQSDFPTTKTGEANYKSGKGGQGSRAVWGHRGFSKSKITR